MDFLNSYLHESAGKLMRCYDQVEDFQNSYLHESRQDLLENWCGGGFPKSLSTRNRTRCEGNGKVDVLLLSDFQNPHSHEPNQNPWESWCVASLTSAPRSSTRPWFFPIGWTWFIFLKISFVCDKNMLNRLCTWDLEFRVKYNDQIPSNRFACV